MIVPLEYINFWYHETNIWDGLPALQYSTLLYFGFSKLIVVN